MSRCATACGAMGFSQMGLSGPGAMERVRSVQGRRRGRKGNSSDQGKSDGANERQLHPVNFPSKKNGFLAVRLPMGGALDAWLTLCLSAFRRPLILTLHPFRVTMPQGLANQSDLNHRQNDPIISGGASKENKLICLRQKARLRCRAILHYTGPEPRLIWHQRGASPKTASGAGMRERPDPDAVLRSHLETGMKRARRLAARKPIRTGVLRGLRLL